jgi:oligopeptide/dipeptide ABC transporter ATP-binding protein
MRELADAGRISRFMRGLGNAADREGACYLTGGATAVLLGWRESTIDVDVRLVPETEALLRSIPRLTSSRSAPLFSIPGQPPDLTRPPQGCRFAARCGHATAECSAGSPPLVGAGHVHACLHPAQGAA